MILCSLLALGVVTSLPELPSDRNGAVRFQDVTQAAGIHWKHENGATPEKFVIEMIGGGGAFLDFDNDGWMDIYLVNSGSHERSPTRLVAPNALYRNHGDGTFRNVTKGAGVEGRGYGDGVAVGDFDNDGWADMYVTNFGPNILYRNRGDGTFEDVTDRAGVAMGKWSTSAAFFDMENDGDLDLFVCNYLDWNYKRNFYCGERREGYRLYCNPRHFPSLPSVLFRNNGNGTFTEVTKAAGLDHAGKALGVVTGDIDGDGFSEIYVANDTIANFLFKNKGNGSFEEIGLFAGVAYGIRASPESGMGTDFGDFDGDGRIDLMVTNIDQEMNNLYSNQGEDWFADVTVVAGLGQVAILFSGFGVRFLDYDNDGDLDLVVLNGHVSDNIHLYKPSVRFAESPFLLENVGGRFRKVGEEAGKIWETPLPGRALAAGDYDNDGDSDLLFVNNDQAPVLLRNDGGNRNPWLGLSLVGSRSNRDGVGAVVTVSTNRRTLVRHRHGGGSYQAAHDPRLIFGLVAGEELKSIEIRWPGGAVQTLEPLELGRYHLIREPE